MSSARWKQRPIVEVFLWQPCSAKPWRKRRGRCGFEVRMSAWRNRPMSAVPPMSRRSPSQRNRARSALGVALILDTGPLLGALDAADPDHERCAALVM